MLKVDLEIEYLCRGKNAKCCKLAQNNLILILLIFMLFNKFSREAVASLFLVSLWLFTIKKIWIALGRRLF